MKNKLNKEAVIVFIFTILLIAFLITVLVCAILRFPRSTKTNIKEPKELVMSMKTNLETEGSIRGSGGMFFIHVRGHVREEAYFYIVVQYPDGSYKNEKIKYVGFTWIVDEDLEVGYRERTVTEVWKVRGEVTGQKYSKYTYYLPVQPTIEYDFELPFE